MNDRRIQFDAYGNMLFPGYVIVNEEGCPLCGKESQHIIQFYTEEMAREFLEEHPELAEGARIVEYTFKIAEGDMDE